MRQMGKSWFLEQWIEEALARGEVVGIASRDGLTVKKRVKHLTVIEFRKWTNEKTTEL